MTCTEYIRDVTQAYRVVKTLSRKNGGTVLQLRHLRLGQDLVLRYYTKPVPAYDVLKSFCHPNLPAVYDTLRFPDGQIVLEEYVEGLSVAEVLETGRYTARGAADVLRKTCAAVSALHQCGILHRDIKPENVLVTAAGDVKLIDLNASQLRSQESKRESTALGTIGYAAYEQLGISQCDERTDVFALGVLLNVMLTLEHPSRCLAGGHLGRVVRKCTQIDPNSRYPDAQSLMLAL